MANKVRAGIVGLDHWYAGLEALEVLKADPRVELVVVAHRDMNLARSVIEAAGAEATTDYASIVERKDLDMVFTACRTVENAALCIRAAQTGKHIVSVKPLAMNMDEARAVGAAVKQAGVMFMGHECRARIAPEGHPFRQAVESRRIGRPVNILVTTRYPLPVQVWPNVIGRTWWLDPTQAPTGAWMDHAIYWIDELRYILGSEPMRISGEVNNVQHPDELLEDFGTANVVFGNGCVAVIEVTWTALPGANVSSLQMVGSEGQMALGPVSDPVGLYVAEKGQPFTKVMRPAQLYGSVAIHLVDCILGTAQPQMRFGDSYQNLRVCLAFYKAAAQHRVVSL